MSNHTASTSAAFVVGDQKVAILLYPEFKIVKATFWNTNNGGIIIYPYYKTFWTDVNY